MFLLKVVQSFQAAGVKFALCGGQAVALHGAVRGTVDVDFILRITEKNFELAEKVLREDLGLISRVPLRAAELVRFRQEYIQKRNLKAWSFVNPSRASECVDLVITHDLNEFDVVEKTALGSKLPVLAIGDLIQMKRESGRPQDLADIEALEFIRKQSKSQKK